MYIYINIYEYMIILHEYINRIKIYYASSRMLAKRKLLKIHRLRNQTCFPFALLGLKSGSHDRFDPYIVIWWDFTAGLGQVVLWSKHFDIIIWVPMSYLKV